MNPIPFVKVVDSLLQLKWSAEPTEPLQGVWGLRAPIRVISILGKARMGKSTFLNCLISYFTDTDAYVFPTQENDEHCTQGIDMYILREKNLIFLDCQGVEYDDSSQDSKLLLLAYLLSDIVIFNERNMLSNSTLHSFQPMAAFIQYLHLEQLRRPHLFFRISDVDLKLDAGTNLNNMLAAKTDHYQSIRESIKLLFSSASAVKTAALDRAEKNLLNNHLYKGMLLSKENLFSLAAADLETILSSKLKTTPRTFKEWTEQIPELIESINRNEKIDYKKLDVVELLAFKEITEFIAAVDAKLYEPITVDGTHITYMTAVYNRMEKVREVLEEFKRCFSAVSDSSGEKGRRFAELQARLVGPVDEATEKTIRMARAYAVPRIKREFQSEPYTNPEFKYYKVCVKSDSYTKLLNYKGINDNHQLWSSFNTKNMKIYKDIAGHLYNPIVEEYEAWWSDIMRQLKAVVAAEYDKETAELERVRPLVEEYVTSTILDDIVKVLFKDERKDSIRRPVADILKEMQATIMEMFNTAVADWNITFNGIEVSIKNIGVDGKFGELSVNHVPEKMTKTVNLKGTKLYELVEDAKKRIQTIVQDGAWRQKLLGRRRRLLGSMIITSDMHHNNLLIVNNPHVEFVLYKPPYGLNIMYTKDRFKKDILGMKLIKRTLNYMESQKLVTSRHMGHNILDETCIKKNKNFTIVDMQRPSFDGRRDNLNGYFYDVFVHYLKESYLRLQVEGRLAKK